MSAGTLSPVCKVTRSPGTSCLASKLSSLPSLMQLQTGGTRCFSFSRVCSLRYSWMKPTVTTMTMARLMLAASSNCFMAMLPTAEARSSKMRGFLNCSRYFFHTGSASFTTSSLNP